MTTSRPRDTVRSILELLAVAIAVLLIYGHLHPAHAAGDAAPAGPAPTWNLGEVMALIALIIASVGAVVDAVRAVLHFTAPRTTSTLDDRAAAALDSLHDRISALEGAMMRPAITGSSSAPAPKSPALGVGVTAGIALILALAVGAGTTACGGNQSSRAATISSIDAGIMTARASVRTYELDHARAIIESTDKPARAAPLADLRGKVDKVILALDSATVALDAARGVNDDTSIQGAAKALQDALASVAALTGGAQ